jgi:hypothetical protein
MTRTCGNAWRRFRRSWFQSKTKVTTGAGVAQIGRTLEQYEAMYGAVLEKDVQGWHTFKKEPYYVLVHFYNGKADAVST